MHRFLGFTDPVCQSNGEDWPQIDLSIATVFRLYNLGQAVQVH